MPQMGGSRNEGPFSGLGFRVVLELWVSFRVFLYRVPPYSGDLESDPNLENYPNGVPRFHLRVPFSCSVVIVATGFGVRIDATSSGVFVLVFGVFTVL